MGNRELDFGDYCEIEQKRYGCDNEKYIYKVIGGGIRSNSWVDVPVKAPGKETLHKTMEFVIRCVCEGVCEEDVRKFRVGDVVKKECDDE